MGFRFWWIFPGLGFWSLRGRRSGIRLYDWRFLDRFHILRRSGDGCQKHNEKTRIPPRDHVYKRTRPT